jgi:hypothetical protein
MSSRQLSHNDENPVESSVKNPAEKSVNGPASAFNAAENAKIKTATHKNEDEYSEPTSSVLKDYPPSEWEDDTPVTMADTEVDTGLEIVHLRKPADTRYVKVYPEFKTGWILPGDRERRTDPYRVSNTVGKANLGVCRRALFAAWIDQFGNYGIWPILLENKNGDVHPYNKSAMEKVRIAAETNRWFAIRSVKGQSAYRLYDPDPEAAKEYGEPKWPAGGVNELLDKAFEDHKIDSNDHPVLREARGRRTML